MYYACVLQRTVSKLYDAKRVRNWLRLAPPKNSVDTDELQASLAAVLVLAAPFIMLKVSVFSFLIGLAVYQGFVWTRNLDISAASGDSRNVFIALIAANGLCILFFFITFFTKTIENVLRSGKMVSDDLGEDEPVVHQDR